MSDGSAVFACALLGGTKHCFGCVVIVSNVFFGLRGLMSLSCGTFMLVRCVDWWSVSWHCLVFVCVSKVVNIAALFIYFFKYFSLVH